MKVTNYDRQFANKLMPCENQVVIVEVDTGEDMIGSLYVPDNARAAPQVGLVLAVGPEVSTLFAGNLVVFPRYSGSELTRGRSKFVFIRASEILAVVKDVELEVFGNG